jgi:hypothetical protein
MWMFRDLIMDRQEKRLSGFERLHGPFAFFSADGRPPPDVPPFADDAKTYLRRRALS